MTNRMVSPESEPESESEELELSEEEEEEDDEDEDDDEAGDKVESMREQINQPGTTYAMSI